MLQLFGIDIPLARLYIYVYIFKYIYTHIQIYIHIYLHVLLLNFLTPFSLRMLCLKKPYNMDFFKKFKTKIFIFEYYPKIPLEMNSTHPFYPILIPNIPYVKFLYLKIISTKIYRKIFFIEAKKIKYPCLKNVLRVSKTMNLWIFFHRGIRDKKFGKVKNFMVWVASRFLK